MKPEIYQGDIEEYFLVNLVRLDAVLAVNVLILHKEVKPLNKSNLFAILYRLRLILLIFDRSELNPQKYFFFLHSMEPPWLKKFFFKLIKTQSLLFPNPLSLSLISNLEEI